MMSLYLFAQISNFGSFDWCSSCFPLEQSHKFYVFCEPYERSFFTENYCDTLKRWQRKRKQFERCQAWACMAWIVCYLMIKFQMEFLGFWSVRVFKTSVIWNSNVGSFYHLWPIHGFGDKPWRFFWGLTKQNLKWWFSKRVFYLYSYLGEMIQFNGCIFFKWVGWNHHLNIISSALVDIVVLFTVPLKGTS